ncbi:ZinT/AdcA family metal-binding protein [Vibrio sp. SCSIO 43137]|uniref:ZinT/AdcA family metal-binding protein n=1 Tax=Vibrio sp. SCSIO 43137 TaxID=3021011 RepID=UPI002308208A|nr:ZinT/AdcA family metal-binding protein [Vibrio sp. SCSIO 43137]WCE30809.1 ZinT/AdcA family metal-binding protein [Vibrio sp. SCSIO 43137]
MNKKLITSLIFIVCLFSNSLFAGGKSTDTISDLTPWKGYSTSVIELFQNESGEKFFEEMVKNLPNGYTNRMAKDFVYDLYATKINSLSVIDENTITINDKMTGDYAYIASISVARGEKTVTWHIFKTDAQAMIHAGFKYILFIPFDQHGPDTLRHSHFRFGNENFDFLTTDPSLQSWWPTLYQPSEVSEAKAIEQMTRPKLAKKLAAMLKNQ